MDITQSTWNALKRICLKHIYVRRLTISRLYKVHNIVTGLKNSAYVVYFDAFDSQQTHTRRRIMRKWYCIRNHVTKHVTWFSPLSLSLCESLIICFDFVHRDSSFRCCVLIFVVYLFLLFWFSIVWAEFIRIVCDLNKVLTRHTHSWGVEFG